jgi:hypothetical protein
MPDTIPHDIGQVHFDGRLQVLLVAVGHIRLMLEIPDFRLPSLATPNWDDDNRPDFLPEIPIPPGRQVIRDQAQFQQVVIRSLRIPSPAGD